MKAGQSLTHPVPIPRFDFGRLWRRTMSHYAWDKGYAADPVEALRQALAREAILLRQRDSLIEDQQLQRSESEHRLLNGLQMVVGLLMLQSRGSAVPYVALQLSVAASRVATIERIHRRLRSNDGTQTVEFRKYLDEFCKDFSYIMDSDGLLDHTILVQCAEVSLPAAVAIPLGFIVNELITNAVKHGKGLIGVRLEARPGQGYILTVTNEEPALPEGFDPAASKGLGMKIVQSFVKQIGGELRCGRDDTGQGAQFAVHFS